MKENLQNKIFSDFPQLYVENTLSPMETCMCWGIECGDGWYDLIYDLSKAITEISNDVVVSQVKEKFGGLRFYYRGGNDDVYDLVCKAENDSYEICEYCGSKDNITQTEGWVMTVCDKCLKEFKEKK